MELLIGIGIVGILASISIPTYLNYTKKSYFSEIVTVGDSYKGAVASCIETTGNISDCDAGTYGIPPNITTPSGAVSSTSVVNGVITIVPASGNGISSSETYILTPTITSSGTVWVISGGACDADLVNNCGVAES